MIKTLTLTYFRKHEALTINLTEGLQTFRGQNEAGKTTLLEAAAYAMFGSKALRDPLADVVTWGHKENELAVELSLCIDKDYLFKRSKAGAEVVVDGVVFVTGQNEVSAFAANLLGADINTARHLMLSDQGGLRGVLEQGPKGTSTLIETLSDLDVIDRIIKAATEKLTLGSTAVLEDRLKQIEIELANTPKPEAPKEPDLAEARQQLGESQVQLEAATIDMNKAEAVFSSEFAKREKRDQLERDRNSVLKQAEETALQLAAEKVKAEEVVQSPDSIRASLAVAEDYDNRVKAYRTFKELVKPDLTMPVGNFKALETRLRAELQAHRSTITDRKATIKALEPQVATSHSCPACGQDTSHLEEVKAKQALVQANLATARAELEAAEAALPEALENVTEIEGLVTAHNANMRVANRISQYVEIDDSQFPAAVTWKGEVPVEGDQVSIEWLRKQLEEIDAAIAARTKAEAKVEALREVTKGYAQRNAEIDEQIKALELVDDEVFFTMNETYTEARDKVTTLSSNIELVKTKIETEERGYNLALSEYTQAKSKVVALEESASVLRSDIESVAFNNSLVKKVRAARPIIANKLWNLVLTSVSTLFTQMRGETSIVTKVGDKFLINGKSSSVSGSTLDILGLAIRCALIKTFAPGCPFLVLDEPSASCDAERTASLIGFVAGAGFKQILLVTHEDASDALSTNLIQL